jgi:Calcium/calmodulin dependent protein kinase II association domain
MSDEATLINLTRCLLESIVAGNWEAYSELCDPTISCFEPEALGNLVEGMAFHRFYFDLSHKGVKIQATMVRPHVRIMGDAAVVSYVRVTQLADTNSGAVSSKSAEETRIWHKIDGKWKHVHFHRSACG